MSFIRNKIKRYTWRMLSGALLSLGLVALLACGSDAAPTPTTAPAAAAPAATATPTEVPAPEGFAVPGQNGVPASVGQVTVAVDGWGWDSLNPIQIEGPVFIQDYINPFMLMRDTDHSVVSGLFVDWGLDDEGFSFTIHPNATWQDGNPIIADDVQWSIYAQRGDFPEFLGHSSANRFQEEIKQVDVYDDKSGKIITNVPVPDFTAFYSGEGYHQVHVGNPHKLKEMGIDALEKDYSMAGGGPYSVVEFKPSERIMLERWEDFWGNTSWLHKPQHQTLEIILSTDEAARYALLRSGQVDMTVNIPYVVAKDLPRSENFVGRGINPDQGDVWTQTVTGTGNMNIDFVNLMSDSLNPPTPEEVKPFDDIRVREAFELAIDKTAISENAHFGFTLPMTSLWFSDSFGFNEAMEVSEYNPEKAKQLLEEAGYGDGFKTEIYFGPFVNSPGQKEWLGAAASYLSKVGIELEIFETPTQEFYSRCCFGAPDDLERPYRPLIVQTWGRQEHAGVLVNYGYHQTGAYICCWDEVTEQAWNDLRTTDKVSQQATLNKIEKHVLDNRWAMPMVEVGVVNGYDNRVLAHPTAPHASSFEQLWRIVTAD